MVQIKYKKIETKVAYYYKAWHEKNAIYIKDLLDHNGNVMSFSDYAFPTRAYQKHKSELNIELSKKKDHLTFLPQL